MAMTFDATLKDLGREAPRGFLAAFDHPPQLPVTLLNVDLSTVTALTDLVIGLGDPLREIVHLDFQASAAAWKHADVLLYNAVLYATYHVPVHSLVLLLRPKAAHYNLTGVVHYAARPQHGSMQFSYQLVRVWEYDADDLLKADLGVSPLAILGKIPDGIALEDGLRDVARRLGERVVREAPPERAAKLLFCSFLLAGLRVPRAAARRLFERVPGMHESDTYLAVIDEGREAQVKEDILYVGTERFGAPDASQTKELNALSDLDHLKRVFRRALKAASWQETLDTP